MKRTEADYRQAARRLRNIDGDIEIEPDAVVSISGSGGAYIQAWVWLADTDVKPGEGTARTENPSRPTRT